MMGLRIAEFIVFAALIALTVFAYGVTE